MTRNGYVSTKPDGFRTGGLPWRLYQKAKANFWDPAQLDFSVDRSDWSRMSEREHEYVTHLASLFMIGEEAVTIDILPLIRAIAREGRVEETMFLTTFALDEAKHLEFFRMFFDEMGVSEDLSSFQTNSYSKIFDDALPEALGRLDHEPSPENQAIAAVVYNHVVEGVLAMTGYYSWGRVLNEQKIFPGLAEGLTNVQRDERRHMAYGTFLCRRLVAADPSIWVVIQKTITELTEPAMSLIEEGFERYGDETPFGISKEDLVVYASTQFPRRLEVIEAAVGKTLEDIEGALVEERLEAELEAVG